MELNFIDGAMLKKGLKGAANYLQKNKEEINSLNVFPVPDGDTGTNMSLTIQSAVKKGLSVEENDASKIALAASQGSLMGARGNSGVILSQLFRGFANGIDGVSEITIKDLAQGFEEAAKTAYKAVMKPTEGTILTVARECGEYAQKIYKDEENILVFLEKVIAHGNETLNKTPDMLPVLKEAGVVDAGGKGLMAVLTGAYNALAGIEMEDVTDEDVESKFQDLVEHKTIDINPEDIKFGYCTEFMINGDIEELEVERLRSKLSFMGDSLMAVHGDGLVKVHVHTNNPGQALEEAIKLGNLTDIKIDNMRHQHELLSSKKEKKISKKYSFVAVSTGEGISRVFKDLHVDNIVEGGQTMNPSTEDIKKAIDETEGENVFIFPNNGNIILAAEQTKEISDRNVIVIPTKTIAQGISALFEFDEELSPDENEARLIEGMKSVKTGQITYSIRDTEIGGIKINKDDIIGISEGDIVANGRDMEQVVTDLLKDMVDEDSYLITIFYGSDVSKEDAEEMEAFIEENYEDFDIELIDGGQPIYYYIFSVE